VAAWLSGSALISINEVIVRPARPVSTGMGGRLQAGKPPPFKYDQPLRPTQLSALSGTENEYRPKCGDALPLGSKGRHGSFHLWINVGVAGKTV